MTDITPDFNVCLKDKGASPVLTVEFDSHRINSFIDEAYKIVRSRPGHLVDAIANPA